MALSRERAKFAWLMCIPALGLLAAVAGYPLLRTLYYSFTDAKLATLDAPKWIGLENFVYLFQDADWWRSVFNTLLFSAFSIPLEFIIGMWFALLLHSQFRGRGVVRAAVLVPWAIPTVVSAQMWSWMFHDQYGVINEVFNMLGLLHSRPAWLAEPSLTLLAVVAVDVWKSTPFVTLLLLAGLQTIPMSLYEAARLDGVSRFNRFRYLTLPMLRPAIAVTLIFRLLDTLRIFDLPYVLTSHSKRVASMSIFARQQMMDFQDVGYGSAASFLIFCVIGVIAYVYLRSFRSHLEGEP